jgi:ribonuclease HI
MKEVNLYTDGACSGNPGPGGYGTVMTFGEHRRELSAGFSLTTNNRMEVLAVIAGLEELKRSCRVDVCSDSKYLVDSMNSNWPLKWKARAWKKVGGGAVENVDLWERMIVLAKIHQLSFHWVKGHAGHAENEACDQLAVAASLQKNLPPDIGYEQVIALKNAQADLFG